MKKIHWFTIQNLSKNLKNGDVFEIIDTEIIKQIQWVLKLKIGEDIFIKNEGFGYEGTIYDTQKTIKIKILNKKEELKHKKIQLLFCIPKKDKFELILEKCTEIGITDFYPICSDRTIKTNINFERAQKIIKEASEQAQRLNTPTLHTITNLDEVLNKIDPIIFDVEGENYIKDIQIINMPIISILIGPEGGFSEREINLFKTNNLTTYKIGDTVLKTETAAIVASGIICFNNSPKT